MYSTILLPIPNWEFHFFRGIVLFFFSATPSDSQSAISGTRRKQRKAGENIQHTQGRRSETADGATRRIKTREVLPRWRNATPLHQQTNNQPGRK